MVDLTEIRKGYRRYPQYLDRLSRRPRRTLKQLIDHELFGGSTDPVALELIGGLIAVTKPERVLELGTWIGYSTILIGGILAHQQPAGTIVTVDPGEETSTFARRHVRHAHLTNVAFVHGHSTDPQTAARIEALGPFDVCYIDSSHAYEATLIELEALFGRWLTPDGFVLLHDAATTAATFDPTGAGGVRRALDEWTAARPDMQLFVFEPPFAKTVCGLGLLRRSATTAAHDASS